METSAKGQLGGLDTTDAVRKRLAGESGAWKCGVCNGGKSNREIMEEQEEVVRLADEEEEKVKGEKRRREEVEVPKELKMGFRDEMEAAAAKAKQEDGSSAESGLDEESALLAEGFVRTAPVGEAEPPGVNVASLPAVPAQTVPQPTRTVPLPRQQVVGPPQMQLQQRPANDGVPMWIDRLIVVFGVCLAFLVVKVFLGA